MNFAAAGSSTNSYGTPTGGTVKSFAMYYGSHRSAVVDSVNIPVTSIVKAAGT